MLNETWKPYKFKPVLQGGTKKPFLCFLSAESAENANFYTLDSKYRVEQKKVPAKFSETCSVCTKMVGSRKVGSLNNYFAPSCKRQD